MRLSLVLAISLTAAFVWAAPASAATVCNVGGVATFLAADVASGCPSGANSGSEVNSVTVSVNAGGAIVFTDANNAVTDGDGGGGCTVSGNTGTCPGTFGYKFDLGAGNDSATIGAVGNGGNVSTGGAGDDHLVGGPFGDQLDGGPGADVLEGAGGDDVLSGGSDGDTIDGGDGNDSIAGGAGDDVENGGSGDDSLDGGPGPAAGSDNDALNGGPGEDHAWYLRGANVTITLNNVAGDGQSGESDNVGSDVEDVTSGFGADTLIGSDGRNVLDGGPGPDSLSGLGGNDVLMDSGGDAAADSLDGGAGDDSLAAGAGPDNYSGGDGEDTITDYAGRTFGVQVTLDDTADDGAPGEGDNVRSDVEDVIGSSAADTLVGNGADNQLDGGAGDDSISGGDGNDGLDGGAGRDTLDGGGGRDDVVGGPGGDTLKLRDGLTDRGNCGGGTDAVQGEARDDIAGNCENVSLAAPAPVTINSVQVTRSGFVVVRISCPAVEQLCSGMIFVKSVRRLSGRVITLAKMSYRLRGNLSKVIRKKIGPKDIKPLKRARRVKVRAVVTNVNGNTGASTGATKLATVTTRGL